MFEKLIEEKTNLEPSNHFDLKKIFELGDWKELFLGLFNVARELFFILDKEGIILSINQFGATSLDYSTDELKGKHFIDLIDPLNTQLVNSSINLALKNNSSFFEASLINKYEKINHYEISIRTIRKENKIIGLLGVGKDITLFRKLEKELAVLKPKLMEAERLISLERMRSSHHNLMLNELNKMKSEFVSNISHEMRTPLASIVGFSETIASDPNMPVEMLNEFNLIILNEGKRLARMINNILDLSRMETGKIVLNKAKVDIVKVIKKMIDNNKEALLIRNLSFSLEALHEEIFIEADEERLLQALNSLFENAIKFSNDGGRVKVILNNLYREVEIIISDTGIGIPEKDMPFLFQKFYTVNRPESETSGAGMGLVFVKQIVDLHKGLISIQSEPNKGTSVLIKLLKNIKD